MIKWIKVGDVIEVDDKKAKLISVVEDLTYADLYTFKREDGSKFHWRHENVYKYVMERHIEKLESLLCEQKQRADRAEKRWEKLKEHFINEKEQSLGILSWSRNNGMLELMERLEGENNDA